MNKILIITAMIFLLVPRVEAMVVAGENNEPVTIVLKAPSENEVQYMGDKSGLHFVADLSSVNGLESYTIKISGKDPEATAGQKFHYQKTWPLNGKTEVRVHHHEILIPDNTAAGEYIMTLSCTDKDNNTTTVERKIRIARFGGGS